MEQALFERPVKVCRTFLWCIASYWRNANGVVAEALRLGEQRADVHADDAESATVPHRRARMIGTHRTGHTGRTRTTAGG